ncbi:uncharacterized protein N7496_009304 [Penicillium cataractarum]|uniref:Uncharacterized protein n=1 Tax=Penicillium cataractarum TaxID=2100454 RepID=A0A9W9RP72_9EURO|nr:uncharacterized protein N7496_009304 [Penicillium cataractarum]KAJ5363591.1 hypothetical protein N7496_009304 [Penicillium cataractarum]
MSQSNTPGFYAGPIEFFWVHQAFLLAGLKALSSATLRADLSNALTGTKLLTHVEKLSAGMEHLRTLAGELPIGQIRVTYDMLETKLMDVDRVIQSVRDGLGDLVDPVLPNSYLADRFDEAFSILEGIWLVEGQRGDLGLGPVRWMGYQGRMWDREIVESLGPAYK